MYSLTSYGRMIADSARMRAYAEALRSLIKPGSVVVDIGTGTGIFAMLACRYGARRVYAIEPSDSIQIGREIAVANGCGDRIEFIQDRSQQVTLPERAEVIISDLRGTLPLFQNHLTTLIDARQRLLKPKGELIPRNDTLWATLVEAPDLHERFTVPWVENDFGLDMRAAYRLATHHWCKSDGQVTPNQILGDPCCWARLDYRELETPDISGQVDWVAGRAGTAHGLCLWFDATLAEGIGFSNAPGESELVYGNAFFPLPEPVPLDPGDKVTMTLRAQLVGDGYVWGWDTRVMTQGQGAQVKADFRQSTFFGTPVSPHQLQKRAAGFVPSLNQRGRIDRAMLELMNAGRTLSQIATQVCKQFPSDFTGHEDALSRAGDLSLKYTQ